MTPDAQRIDWIDYSKGICIIMVVMMHSVLDYSAMVGAPGWMNGVVEWTRPFRMPDFFLIAGLFLSKSIFGPKKSFFDKKLVHFAYFYILWLAIQTALFEVSTLVNDPVQFAWIFVQGLVIPKSSLWFIHMLAVFYALTWIVRYVPKGYIFFLAAALQINFALGYVDTGWSVTNRFAQYFVFFYAGYAYAPFIFKFADWCKAHADLAMLNVALWAVVHSLFIVFGLADAPMLSLALGLAGALAIVAVGTQLARLDWMWPLRHAGKFSIVIYLTFFLPMKVMQKGLSATDLIPDIGTAALLITIISVASPLVFHWIIKGTPLNALYERPKWAKLWIDRRRSKRTYLFSPAPDL